MAFEASDAIVVFMTATSVEEAQHLAEKLVEAELAACVQILPQVQSIYRWKDKVERQAEILLIAKTLRSRFPELEREVRRVHSYEVPEVAAAVLGEISQSYLDWLISAVGSSPMPNRRVDQEA
ncbi:MAG: divalent-cation tolerance protein CutA [Pyrinomonadaceae bacterium]